MEEPFTAPPRLTTPPVQPRRTAPPAREAVAQHEQERAARLAAIAAQIAALRAEDTVGLAPAAGRAGHRFVARADRADPAPTEVPAIAAGAEGVETLAELELPAAPMRPRRPRRRPMPLMMRLVLGFYFGAEIVAFGWILGRVFGGRTARTLRVARETEEIRSVAAAGWSAADAQILDAVMADLRDRRLDDAARRTEELLEARPELPGLTRLAAAIEMERGKYAAALVRLNAPDPVRTSLRRALDRADVFAALGRPREIEAAVANAALEDPFSSAVKAAEAVMHRRAGRLREARDILEKALVRARPGRRPSETWLRVQSLLTSIESGEALEPANLASLPAGWRSVVEAANAANRRDFSAARDSLRRAADQLPQAEMRAVLLDLMFEPHASRPELREFYAPGATSR